jgi:hypothetical protein
LKSDVFPTLGWPIIATNCGEELPQNLLWSVAGVMSQGSPVWGDVDIGRDAAGESEPGVPRLNDAWLTNAADGYICPFTKTHGAE